MKPISQFPITRRVLAYVAMFITSVDAWPAHGADDEGPAKRLSQASAEVFPAERKPELARMLGSDISARRKAGNARSTEEWQKLAKLPDRGPWVEYCRVRLLALRKSLGEFPQPPQDLKTRVTRTIEGDGYRIENLVFESRPGLWVTANLYRPAKALPSMPGMLIAHSHHNPKTEGELQDMGGNWARQGAMVLVIDQLGHGERRQHPFVTDRDYAGTFRPSRQDYFFRYNSGIQLHLIGDSLMGWMAWDLMRGVDLLLAQPGIDPKRIILLGAVAGGGDPAAVTAALDPRITAAGPFNFGGPQPESPYPLPEDAETSFNYAGGGSWESTRNLRLSVRDGFLPWVIVGGIAPRRLIYGHEFSWDREHDPVWKRLSQIYRWHGVETHLAFTHGHGTLTGKSPEGSHCNNIGAVHRKGIYAALKDGFDMPGGVDQEIRDRHPAADLLCLSPALINELRPRALHELAGELGAARTAAARERLRSAPDRRQSLRSAWAELLGDIEPKNDPKLLSIDAQSDAAPGLRIERIALEAEPGILLPLLLIMPHAKPGAEKRPVIVGLAQAGKQAFLKHRAAEIHALVSQGHVVCLPDVRGTGETSSGNDRGRRSAATSYSASEWMLGQTLVGGRLRDLRSVLRYLRTRDDLDSRRLALWGESFAEANPADRDLKVPHDADKEPALSEPLGGLLALLGALYEDDVQAVYAQGSLVGWQSVLASPFLYLPHDVVVPGALAAGDVCDLTAALAPRPVRFSALVDGLNRRASAEMIATAYEPARSAYSASGRADHLLFDDAPPPAKTVSDWFAASLRKNP